MKVLDLDEYRGHLKAIRDVFGDCKVNKLILYKNGGKIMSLFNKFSKDEIADLFELLPKGIYQGVVMDHEWKANKSGTGHLLILTFEIIKPKEFAGRKLWTVFNFDNQSETAQKIALRDFRALCVAAGAEVLFDAVFASEDIDALARTLQDRIPFDLYNRPVELYVDIVQGDGEYPDRNRIRRYARVITPVAKAPGF